MTAGECREWGEGKGKVELTARVQLATTIVNWLTDCVSLLDNYYFSISSIFISAVKHKSIIVHHVCSRCRASITSERHLCCIQRMDSRGHFNYNAVCWSISVILIHMSSFVGQERLLTQVVGPARYNNAGPGQRLVKIAAFQCYEIERKTGLELCGVLSCLGNNYHDIETTWYDTNIAISDTMRYIVPTLHVTILNI